VTLVYLAAQIRQNTAQLRANAESIRIAAQDETQRSMDHWRGHLIGQRDVAELWERGLLRESSLDSTDSIRFELLLSELLYSWQAVFRRAMHAGDLEHWEAGIPEAVRFVLSRPRPREYWERARSNYIPNFTREIDRLLSSAPPAAQQGAAADDPQQAPIDP
jgi:hypothetical protein